jgi:hypothetical protein
MLLQHQLPNIPAVQALPTGVKDPKALGFEPEAIIACTLLIWRPAVKCLKKSPGRILV